MPGKQVKKEDITFSDIYNVINNPATHDGTSPISFNSFRSSIVDVEARKASLPPNQDYKFNYSEGTNKTISNYNNLIVTNVGSPVEYPNLNLPRPHIMTVWPTANDIQGDGSVVASDPLHAWLPIPDASSNSSDYDWMSGNTGDATHRYTFSFMLLHNSTKSTLNIHWKRWSDEVGGDNFYIYELATNSGDNYKNPGTPGIYYPPTSDGFTPSGDNGGEQASGTVESTAEYIALYYYKHTPDAGVGDDRTYIRIRGAETGLVPYNFVDTTPIILNRDISLNSITTGKMYAPTKSFKFTGEFIGKTSSGATLPTNKWGGVQDVSVDGDIRFDAGPNNAWKIFVIDKDTGTRYAFPGRTANGHHYGQLALLSSDNSNNSFDPLTQPGLAKTNGEYYAGDLNQQIHWPNNGNVIPLSYDNSILYDGAVTNGGSGGGAMYPMNQTPPNPSFSTNKRYIKFIYKNNVSGAPNNWGDAYNALGWEIHMQRIVASGGSDYTGTYTGTLSYPSININSDFRTRIKNQDPILKITEADGIDSSGNTTTNKDTETINLHLDVSGSRPTTQNPSRISTDKLYDLSLNDITASNNTVDISSAFSGINGTSSFILASIGKVGQQPQTITIDVSANTFRNEYGNWNDVSGSNYGKFTWNYHDITPPTMVITAAEGTTPFTSNDGTLSLTFTSSESTTDFSVDDITPTKGNLTNFQQVGTTTVYTATFTPNVDGLTPTGGPCTINVAGNTFMDLAGNNNTASDIFAWTRDTVRPTMDISAAVLANSNNSTSNATFITLTFTSSESTTDFSGGVITTTNGAIFNFTEVSSEEYIADFYPSGESNTSSITCTINVAENAFTSLAGNGNDPSVFTWISDRAAPTCSSITLAPGETTSPGSKTIYFDFTESPQNFPTFSVNQAPPDASDLRVLPPVTPTNLTYITPTRLSALVQLDVVGSYAISIPENRYTDLAGNLNTISPTLNVTISSAPTTIEISKGTSSIRYAPFYGLYDYSQFGIIYLAEEILQAGIQAGIDLARGGNISSLFFQYTGWYTNYTAINQTVKFSHTDAIQIERGPDGGGSSYVYPDYRELVPRDTTTVKENFTFVNPSNEDWEEIGENAGGQTTGFTNEFIWNGIDNILISWENRDDTWESGYGYLRGGGSLYRAHSWYSDYSYPRSSSGYDVDTPNIRLVITPA